MKLEDVVGQEQVTGPLQKSLKAGKINHAYLFVGGSGYLQLRVKTIIGLACLGDGLAYDIVKVVI